MKGSILEAKIDPNRTQNETKFKTIFKSEKLLFKSLLGPSWADLGAFWRPSWAPIWRSRTRGRVFGEKSRF